VVSPICRRCRCAAAARTEARRPTELPARHSGAGARSANTHAVQRKRRISYYGLAHIRSDRPARKG
jgi:hypothetical protein